MGKLNLNHTKLRSEASGKLMVLWNRENGRFFDMLNPSMTSLIICHCLIIYLCFLYTFLECFVWLYQCIGPTILLWPLPPTTPQHRHTCTCTHKHICMMCVFGSLGHVWPLRALTHLLYSYCKWACMDSWKVNIQNGKK